MAGYYTIKVMSEFAAAHALRGYQGDCARLHGHNWKVEIEVFTQALNAIGIGMDFKDIKAALKSVINLLDHRYLNEIPPFDIINPSAENVIAWIYHKLAPTLNRDETQLIAATIWENDRSSVRYTDHPPPSPWVDACPA